ncbi:TATA-box-binding protein [Ochlerotatus camptorhynchus]|uniref:TATA-box-binding protein n=1 Tax=Ochlerotatus camptorhynchus TaxID=644619 RepID=UPI0031E1527E
MYCSNQSSMATLLQQKSFMKNLTNGTNNVVVVNGTNDNQTATMVAAAGATMATVPGSASRMLLPHETTTTLIHQQPLIHQQTTFTSSHLPASSSISLTNSSSFNSQFISHLQSNHHLSTQQIFGGSNSSHPHIVTTTATPTTSFQSQFNNAYVDVNAIFRSAAASPTTTSTATMQSFSSTHHPLPHLTNNTSSSLVYINGTQQSSATGLSKSSHLHSHHQHQHQTVSESQTANTTDSARTTATSDGYGDCGNGTEEQPATATGETEVNSTVAATAEKEDDQEQEPEPEIDIVINNVVCSFSVRCHLNLRNIALNGFNVEFRRENGMVTMKLRRPYTTASIWSSGKITCTGATSEDQAKVAARRYSRCLQKLGFNVRFRNFRIVNVLGTCSMPWGIMIVNFSERYKKDASYEPELHPGVTYKLYNPKATLKIFSTGSITVTAASVAFVQAAIEQIFPLVYEFRKKRTPQEKIEILKPPVFDPELLIEEECDIDESATMFPAGGNAGEGEGACIEIVDDDDGDAFDDDEDVRSSSNHTKAIHQRRNHRRSCKSRYSSSSQNGGRRRPAGKADNDPTEDAMFVSDDDDDDIVEELIESDDE